jgi:protein-tyrosine phosphatase
MNNTSSAPLKRFPAMSGGLNFRDLGGYDAAGRRVRWNRLYRSGTTHTMTDDDLALLASRGIRYAYDLRSNGERRRHPNRLSSIEAIDYRFLDHEHIPGDLTRALRDATTLPGHSRSMMISLYERLPYDFRDAYRELFTHLANDELPLVFNCAAGKDRTGVAAALILIALGVSRDEVFEDYLLTERSFEQSCEIILRGNGAHLFAGIERAVWEPVMRTDAVYLEAMLERLNLAHGSVENYFAQELKLSEQTLDRIRANLLE